MNTNIAFTLVISIIICVLILMLLLHPRSIQKAVQKMVEEREKKTEYWKNVLAIGDKVIYKGRRCSVLRIKYLSEVIKIKDEQTEETCYVSPYDIEPIEEK